MGYTATKMDVVCCTTIGASQIHIIIIYDFVHFMDVFHVYWTFSTLERLSGTHNAAADTLNILLEHRTFFNGFSLTNEWKIKINCMFLNCALLTAF